MYFIRAFGSVGVDISKEFFHTTDLYIGVLHLMKGALSGIGVSVTGVNSLWNC